MACRVGITTNLTERKAYWRREQPSMYGFEVLDKYSSRQEAEAAEKQFADRFGCRHNPGGASPNEYGATWYVYLFYY